MTQNSLAFTAADVPHSSFYGMLTAAERKMLHDMAIARTSAPGITLMLEGDPAASLTVLLHGWTKAFSVTRIGSAIVLRIYGPGDLFGGETILGIPRTESVAALTECHSLWLRTDQFTGLLSKNPGIARAFNLVTLRHVRDADERIKAQLGTGAQRLARNLLDLADRVGVKSPYGITIPVELSQEDLASWADTSRSTVARALSDWRRRCLIRTGYRSTTITDPVMLRKIAGAHF